MKSFERRKNEGTLEYWSRLAVTENLGVVAVAAVGAVLMPPLAPVLTGVAVIEGLQAGGFSVIRRRLEQRRLKKAGRGTS
jgi:hypothetical protein